MVLGNSTSLCAHMFSGAFHAGNHAGFEEQWYAEDPRLRSWACGETEEVAEDSGGWLFIFYFNHILFEISFFPDISEN